MKTFDIDYCGIKRTFNLLEEYKGLKIVNEIDELESVCVQVYNPVKNTLFIVCMDDSKNSGRRTFDESANNVESAKNYIDWLVN